MALAAVLAACGAPAAREAGVPAPAGPRVDVTMTDFRFSPNPIQVAAGHVSFHVMNVGHTGHDFTVLTPDGSGRLAHTALVEPGGMVTVSLDLIPGTYPVLCTQPGHQELGMAARIVASSSAGG